MTSDAVLVFLLRRTPTSAPAAGWWVSGIPFGAADIFHQCAKLVFGRITDENFVRQRAARNGSSTRSSGFKFVEKMINCSKRKLEIFLSRRQGEEIDDPTFRKARSNGLSNLRRDSLTSEVIDSTKHPALLFILQELSPYSNAGRGGPSRLSITNSPPTTTLETLDATQPFVRIPAIEHNCPCPRYGGLAWKRGRLSI